MNPQVLCLDGLTSDDDPEDISSDVDGEDGVFQDPIPDVVSVRPEVTEKWMDWFVVDLVESPSVSRKSAVARTCLRSIPLLFLLWGGGVADVCPLVVVVSDPALMSVLQLVESDTARVSVPPVAGCKFRQFFWGRSPLMWLAWALARRVSEWIRRMLC